MLGAEGANRRKYLAVLRKGQVTQAFVPQKQQKAEQESLIRLHKPKNACIIECGKMLPIYTDSLLIPPTFLPRTVGQKPEEDIVLKISVIDDEIQEARKIRDMLASSLDRQNELPEISVFLDARTFLNTFAQGRYDIIFLDIQMPEMDGMTCAQEIRRRDSSVILIFFTSMIQYAVQGYRVEATDYLVKPVEPALLKHSLHRALKHLNKHQKLAIRSGDSLYSLNTDDLLYVEAVNHRTILHTTEESIHSAQTMAAIETQLQGCGFFRCHQGFLVNMKRIQRIERNSLLISDKTIPISKYRHREFMRELTAYWGKTL